MFAIRCLSVFGLFLVASSPVLVQGDDTHTVCMCDAQHRSLLTAGTRFLADEEEICSCESQGGAEISFSECCEEKDFFDFILDILFGFKSFFTKYFGAARTRRELSGEVSFTHVEQVRPESQPVFDGESVLLAENIGLWMFPNFLNAGELEETLAAAKAADAHSYDCKVDFCERRAHNKRCIDNPAYQSKIQPEGKTCLSVVNGALELMDEPDQQAWKVLHQKTVDLWPQYPSENPVVYQRTDAATDKFKYHVDGMEHNFEYGMISPVTVVVYLSDGGSELIFPRANGTGVTITPKKGMAITWFNMDEDFKPLMTAVHGVQATGDFVEPRLAVQNEFTLDNSFFDVGLFEKTY